MPIVIVLLATIVAFLLGGPIIAIAVLLIGLIIVFPNVMGIVAAIIGAIILLATLSIKFDISLGMLILIGVGVFIGIFVAIYVLLYLTSSIQEKIEDLKIEENGYHGLKKLKEEEEEYLKLMDDKDTFTKKKNK